VQRLLGNALGDPVIQGLEVDEAGDVPGGHGVSLRCKLKEAGQNANILYIEHMFESIHRRGKVGGNREGEI
jgi:hypothetical protein